MRPSLFLTAALAVSLISATPAAGKPKAHAAHKAAPAAVSVAPLKYSYRQLPNGLKVYAIRDPGSANVAIQVWYNVGSKDDPAGRSGFAHLFEHMMFKATRDLPAESFDRMTEDVGGSNNASTNDDYTNYYEVAPANYLKTLLWAEAERMGSLVVDEANFKSERDVVKEELRQRVLAQPYGKLFALYAPEISFSTSPYGRPGIGSIEDLDSATLADVQAFHATYYRPDNAVMVVAGNFDPAQLDQWVDQFFGPIAKPSGPIPRVTAVEPRRAGPKTWEAFEPNTPLPAVMVTWPTPAASSPDIPALIVLDALLTKGDSARLNHSLVYEQQVAQQAFSNLSLTQQPNIFVVGAVLSEGKTIDQGQDALLAEIARLRTTPVSAAELARAKNQLVTDALRQRETALGQSEELAQAVVIYGDASKANRLVSDLQAVSAADVQRVARKYLADDQRAVVRYQSDEKKPAGAPSFGPASSIRAQALVRPADLKVYELAPPAERVAPPAPGEPVSAPLPRPVERTLKNGLRVVVAPRRDVPLVSVELVVRAGSARDPDGRSGEASMTAGLLTKGTRTRSATRIAEEIESMGGEIGAEAGVDGSTLALTVKTDRLAPAMAVFADVARHPAFAADEMERARQQQLNGLEVAMKDPADLAGFAAARAVYGAAPYGQPTGGSKASLARLTPADEAAFHRLWWRPDNAVLVIAGDVSPEQGFAIAEKAFGDWKAPAMVPPQQSWPVTPPGRRVIVIDLPKSGQAVVAVTRIALSRADPRYYSAVLADSVLGGGYSARLNQEIRIKRGLSYGANSTIAFRIEPGPFTATTQTKNESAVEVADLMVAEMDRLGREPAPEAELQARRNSVVGGFGRRVETTDGLAGVIGGMSLYGVDLGEIGRYGARIKAVGPADVQAIGRDVLAPGPAAIVVVGDASVFLAALKAKYPNVEVIRADQVDLDSPTLRKGP